MRQSEAAINKEVKEDKDREVRLADRQADGQTGECETPRRSQAWEVSANPFFLDYLKHYVAPTQGHMIGACVPGVIAAGRSWSENTAATSSSCYHGDQPPSQGYRRQKHLATPAPFPPHDKEEAGQVGEGGASVKCGDGKLDERWQTGSSGRAALLVLFLRLRRLFFRRLVLRRRLFVPTEDGEDGFVLNQGLSMSGGQDGVVSDRFGLKTTTIVFSTCILNSECEPRGCQCKQPLPYSPR